jgi:putative ABC transport system substrate-binding protein
VLDGLPGTHEQFPSKPCTEATARKIDPVAMGLVSAINRPGGNATGVYFPVTALDPKRLELLREFVPELRLVSVLVNPGNPNADVTHLDEAARGFGLQLIVLKARNADEIDTAFASLAKQGAQAVLVTSDPIFEVHRANPLTGGERRFEIVIAAVSP